MTKQAKNIGYDIEQRIIRFDEMIPCKTAFIDAKTPGSDEKENFCLIGGGVAENPDQVVHIDIPHSFNVGAARQPRGCKNSHHSHETEEVFMVHSGTWQFTWGEDGSDGQVVLNKGDVISLPTNMFRGFENVGDNDGMLFAILGTDEHGDAGNVIWAPYVFEQASEHGLVLLEDGRLIDTLAGDAIPVDVKAEAPTTKEQAEQTDSYTLEDMQANIFRAADSAHTALGGLSTIDSVTEVGVIGIKNPSEKMPAGHINRPHNFQLRILELSHDADTGSHTRSEEEVIIIQDGTLEITVNSQIIQLNKGDLITIPINAERRLHNPYSATATAFVIRQGDHPQAATFC